VSLTIEYYGVAQKVRVYDAKRDKTKPRLGCLASPLEGAVEVSPKRRGLWAIADRLMDAFAGTPPLAIDVTPMPPGPADFALSRFAARAADFFKSGVRRVSLDEERAREWGYQGPAEGHAPTAGTPAPAST
jgi:hypothetical protein